jgi:hypothetical protein
MAPAGLARVGERGSGRLPNQPGSGNTKRALAKYVRSCEVHKLSDIDATRLTNLLDPEMSQRRRICL